MSRKRLAISRVVGRVEDIQLPSGSLRSPKGPRAVSLLVHIEGSEGPTYDWLPVASVLRARVHGLAQQKGVLMGSNFAFELNEDGYIVAFSPVGP